MKNTTKDKIDVMLAAFGGRQIQFRPVGAALWVPHDAAPAWNWEFFEYRIKPEPFFRWANVYDTGEIDLHLTKEGAQRAQAEGCLRCIKLVEE